MVRHILRPVEVWANLISLLLLASLQPSLFAVDLPPTGNPCGDCADPCGIVLRAPPPRCPWYVDTGAEILKRDTRGGAPIATVGTGLTPDNILLISGDLNAPYRAGPRLLLGHTFGESPLQLDFTYYWVDSWNDSTAVYDLTANGMGGLGNMFSPFSNFGVPQPLFGYDYNNFVSIRELSELQNGELNLRYTLPMPNPSLTAKFVIGVRYLSLNERFEYQSQAWGSPLLPAASLGLTTRTTNDLVGPQIGGDFYWFAFPQFWINFEFKGALCGNHALQDTNGFVNVDGTVTPLGDSRTRDGTSYVGDLSLTALWQMTPRMSMRIGYQVMWVESVALAAWNAAGQSAEILELGPPQIDTSHGAVYHGPRIDLEWTW
jgi:hypothetical protein